MQLPATALLPLLMLHPADAGRPGPARQDDQAAEVAAVKAALTDFHDAAAKADEERYVARLAPDVVILGTDPTERFTREEYLERIRPIFASGAGPATVPVDQAVFLSGNGRFAWFDERLSNPSYGELRSTGVMRKDHGRWSLVHYHLGFVVPNPLVSDLLERTQARPGARGPEEMTRRWPVRPAPDSQDPRDAVKAVLLDFHLAAATGKPQAYFGRLHPRGTFFGTAPAERFTRAELRALAEPLLVQGRTWTTIPVEQNVFLSEDGELAWFDQRLERTGLGEMRSSGVLVQEEGRWRIVQHNLVFPVPNDLVPWLAEKIRLLGQEPEAGG